MTLLHDFIHSRNQQAFHRLLDAKNDRGQSFAAAGPSTSGGKSWNRASTLTSSHKFDVNSRDQLGRTALHVACSALENIEYVRALLKHPAINVNIADTESHWTALHRALYTANFPAALLLLQRADTDTSLQDLEGYTAFDLYNSTLLGTKPTLTDNMELFTWGTNRNAALGIGDSGDRIHPDQVVIPKKEENLEHESKSLVDRFSPVHVLQVQMSKLHTVVVTNEKSGNIRVCGFGSGGRLGGLGQHTQYSLKPLPNFSQKIVSVALGQDHTLALTDAGEVLSWGLNRFSQLGYVVEMSTAGRLEEPIQSSPKKVFGVLRKEVVKGVAASKMASTCWTDDSVYTWGTNVGQLGYDKAAQPVQVYPRKVTMVTRPVIMVSLSDSAMACLLDNQQVECIWNDRHFKINFPVHAFPNEIQPYRPPQAIRDARIKKITYCDNTFAALSFSGEVFLFSSPSLQDVDGKGVSAFKPQRVWALRKKFSAVKDVALGSDGSIIICTESGHVFVRSRNLKSGQGTSTKNFKFQRLPYIQRVVQVCANSTGAFGALRVDYQPARIEVKGNTIAQDLANIQPHIDLYTTSDQGSLPKLHPSFRKRTLENLLSSTLARNHVRVFEDDPDEIAVEADIALISRLCDVILAEQKMRKSSGNGYLEDRRLPFGADAVILVQSAAFPVHRNVLVARSPNLSSVFSRLTTFRDSQTNIVIKPMPVKPHNRDKRLNPLTFTGCHAISTLILIHYFYSDEVLALWDRRVAVSLEKQLRSLKINPSQVKVELEAFARILELPHLAHALERPVKCSPVSSMVKDMKHLFEDTQTSNYLTSRASPLTPDVILQLADRDVLCHSSILRARSEFFASFFDEEDWTAKRWDAYGMVKVDLKHLEWHVMQYVLQYLCWGADAELFDRLDFAQSVDDVMEFMFAVMAAADELLLDRLLLLCSAVILAHFNIYNAGYILADATHFHAEELVERMQNYMAVNMETLLESGMLDEIPHDLVKQLAKFARAKQTEKSPVSRSDRLVKEALVKHADWLALQDIPQPAVRTNRMHITRENAKLSPSFLPRKVSLTHVTESPLDSPTRNQRPIRRPPSGDDLFAMDDTDLAPRPSQPVISSTSSYTLPTPPPLPLPAWKPSVAPRIDMKSIMAEAEDTAQHVTTSSRASVKALQTDTSSTTSSKAPIAQSSGKGSTKSTLLPWKIPPDHSGLRPSPPGTPSALPLSTSLSRSNETLQNFPNLSTPLPATKSPPQLKHSRSQLTQSGLGPFITPTKQAKQNSSRNVSGGKAWTSPPIQPIASTHPTSGMSFVAIQHSQLEQLVGPAKDKRSLTEIQEEERAKQVEDDFLKWWAAEEERTRQETQALAQFEEQRNHGKESSPKKGRSRKKAGGAQSHGNAPNTEKGPLAESSQSNLNKPRFNQKQHKLSQGENLGEK